MRGRWVRSSDLEHDYITCYESEPTISMILDEDHPTDTGLLDQHGVKLYRPAPARLPIGFCR